MIDSTRVASVRRPVAFAEIPRMEMPAASGTELTRAYEAGRSAGAQFGVGRSVKEITRQGTEVGGTPPSADITRDELAFMHTIAATRTPDGIAAAQEYGINGHHNTWRLELERLRPTLGAADARRAARLLETALSAAREAADVGKSRYDRPRPFHADPTLTIVVKRPTNASFPSGHAASAAAAAEVLAAFAPAERAHFMDIAQQVAWSRTYGGVHYPSDIRAGTEMGAFVGAALVAAEAARFARKVAKAA